MTMKFKDTKKVLHHAQVSDFWAKVKRKYIEQFSEIKQKLDCSYKIHNTENNLQWM